MSEELKFLIDLAHDAGAIMVTHWKGDFAVYKKVDRTLVTDVDLQIRDLVQARAKAAFPDCGLMTEESYQKGTLLKPRGFIVDELDGTSSYVRGIEGFTFQAAWYNEQFELRIGVIYDPVSDILLYCERGEGVFLEIKGVRQRIGPPKERQWMELRFAHHRQYMTNTIRKMYAILAARQENIIPTGSIGSKVIAFAMDQVDAIVGLHRDIAPWDWAPGTVILRELGYRVTHLNGNPVQLSPESDKNCFGYLACPPEHMRRMLKNLAWILKKLYGKDPDFEA